MFIGADEKVDKAGFSSNSSDMEQLGYPPVNNP